MSRVTIHEVSRSRLATLRQEQRVTPLEPFRDRARHELAPVASATERMTP